MKKILLPLALAGLFTCPVIADDWGFKFGVDAFESNEQSKTQASGYAALEHSIIVLPNVRVAYDQIPLSNQQDDLNSIGGILYYQLFDNSLFEIDLGMNLKTVNGEGIDQSFPQFYTAGAINVPATNLSAFVDLTTGTLSDDRATDAIAGLNYTFNPKSFAKFSARAGYRYHQLKLVDKNIDQELSNWYLGAELHF